MNINILKSILVVSSTIFVVGCGGSGTGSNAGTTPTLPTAVQAALDASPSLLTQPLIDTLSYMGNEERLAYDVYNELYRQYGTKQFTNIATKSEYLHITAVQGLIQKYKISDDINFTNIDLPALGYMNTPIGSMQAGTYDISVIQALYDTLVLQGSTSEIEALKVGCTVEVVDVNDLDKDIILATDVNATDIITIFNFLRDGSYNHYWVFDSGLINKGITNGCCSLGIINGVNYCHPEYPKK
jgi:hypothetical protein